MHHAYLQRRNFVTESCRQLALPFSFPRGAFYIFPNITETGLSSKDFALQLLQEKKVAVVPGNAFGEGGEGFVRCSFATSMEKLQIAFQQIALFIKERK
jgi:aminotransferase